MANSPTRPEQRRVSCELDPPALRSSDPLSVLERLVAECPRLGPRTEVIHTVLSELYANALEHGLLGLDSSLKASARGFAAYYAARQQRLAAVRGVIRLDFRCELDASTVSLCIAVTDSGPGFDHERRLAWHARPGRRNVACHGRGLELVTSLCRSVAFHGCGNAVEVELAWSNNDE